MVIARTILVLMFYLKNILAVVKFVYIKIKYCSCAFKLPVKAAKLS